MLHIIISGSLGLFQKAFTMIGGRWLVNAYLSLVKRILAFWICFTIALYTYLLAYYIMIPRMQQELLLRFQQDENQNFIGFYFNTAHKDILCEGKGAYLETQHALSSLNFDIQTLCGIHLYDQEHGLEFEPEAYQVNIQLNIVDLRDISEQKQFITRALPIEVNIIDSNGKSLLLRKMLHYGQTQRAGRSILSKIWDKITNIFGDSAQQNFKVEDILFEGLPNNLIDLQGIVIRIKGSDVFVEDSQLMINPVLKGPRFFLYYRFYSTGLIFSFFGAICLLQLPLVLQLAFESSLFRAIKEVIETLSKVLSIIQNGINTALDFPNKMKRALLSPFQKKKKDKIE